MITAYGSHASFILEIIWSENEESRSQEKTTSLDSLGAFYTTCQRAAIGANMILHFCYNREGFNCGLLILYVRTACALPLRHKHAA